MVACLAVASTLTGTSVRAAALVPAALVGMAVVTTGNHYVVDVVAGLTISVGAWLIFEHPKWGEPSADPMTVGHPPTSPAAI